MLKQLIALTVILFAFLSNSLYCQKNTSKDEILHSLYKDNLHEVLKHKRNGYKPESGVVPDSKSAVKIAEIVLSNIYGEKTIEDEKPFTAFEIEGYWIVYGYLPKGHEGGVAEVFIKKSNGEVIYIAHSK